MDDTLSINFLENAMKKLYVNKLHNSYVIINKFKQYMTLVTLIQDIPMT